MIPAFNDQGYLPPGVHQATMDEILERFGHGSEDRIAGSQSLQWLLPMCRRAGIARLILNGSFVTENPEPRDVDCVLIPGPAFVADSDATLALRIGLPYLSLQVVETEDELDFFVNDLFATDRAGHLKGLIEVIL
jgi:hypothetical protein